jgi:general secretion pathway protein H
MRQARAFTLIELLVVLVIVSVISTGAIVLLGPGMQDQQRAETRRFHALYDLLYEESMLQGGSRGLAIGRSGYAFYRRLPAGGWERLGGRPFEARVLPGAYRFELLLDGVEVELSATAPANPQLWLSPGGATRPFVLLLRRQRDGTELQRFEVDGLGRRSWHADEA